ncbi:hypothetical protein GCM10020000_08990 [Streptomyces olivoverticillatus]
MRLAPVGGHDGEPLRGQGAAQVLQWEEVQVLGLEPGAPPAAEEPGGGGLRVGDLDQQVAARPQGGVRRCQLLPWRDGVLQVVVHAHHVVMSGQLAGEFGEGATVGPGDTAMTRRDLDALADVEPVEFGVRVDRPGDGTEVAVAGAHVQPAARAGRWGQCPGACPVEPDGDG